MDIYAKLIDPSDMEQNLLQKKLLQEAGIRLDPLTDWSLALYSGNKMLATASCYGYTLRSIAVAVEYQEQGLLALLMTEVEKEAVRRSLDRLMLLAQPKDFKVFQELGYYTVAKNSRGVTLMENNAQAFNSFIINLKNSMMNLPAAPMGKTPVRAAIVMNANPFTRGHRYLIESALKKSDQLLVLLLSDNSAQGFSFKDRYELAKRGLNDLPQVLLAPGGPYAVSTASFPSYFYPPSEVDENSVLLLDQAELDAAIFIRIAGELSLSKRFVGTEPLSVITNFYNKILEKELKRSGIELHLIERLKENGEVISASRVRQLLADGDLESAQKLMPPGNREYLSSLCSPYTAEGSEN